jgi:hypothetical protein
VVGIKNFRWSPSCMCCEQCLVFEDYFDRANSTVVAGWDERSGDWSILTNQLHEAGTTGALIVTNADVPRLSFWVAVEIPALIEDAIYKLVANYLDDSNYFSATFQLVTVTGLSQTFTIKLYKSGNLLREETWAFNDVIGEEASLYICLTDETFTACASIGGIATYFCRCIFDPVLIAGGFKAGLGNGSDIAIDYDNFLFYETQHTNPLNTCPDCLNSCGCSCSGSDSLCENGDQDLHFEIVSTCEVLNGITGVLTYYYTPPTPEFPWWEWVSATGLISRITLSCDPDSVGTRWEMYLLGVESASANCGVTIVGVPSDGECKPFALKFDGEVVDVVENGCIGSGCADGDTLSILIYCNESFLALHYLLSETDEILFDETGDPLLEEYV